MLLSVKKRYTLTIPKSIREKLHVKEGEYVEAEVKGHSLVLTPPSISAMKVKMLTELFRKYGVKIAYLFGSQMSAGVAFVNRKDVEIEEGSDLDIGVVFEELPQKTYEVYGELYTDLSILFEPFKVDLVFLQETDSLFQYEAINGNLIYCDDEFFLDDYEEMIMKKATDLSYKKIEFEKDFLEAIKDGYIEIALR